MVPQQKKQKHESQKSSIPYFKVANCKLLDLYFTQFLNCIRQTNIFNKWKENNCQFSIIFKKKKKKDNAMHRNEGWQTSLVARTSPTNCNIQGQASFKKIQAQ